MDPFPVLVTRAPTVLLALLNAATAGWLLFLDFGHRVYRAAALFLSLVALDALLFLFAARPGDFVDRVDGYVALAIPFAAVNFALCYLEQYGARPPRTPQSVTPLRVYLLVIALAFEAAYFIDHRLAANSHGPLFWVGIYQVPILAAIGLVLAREFAIATLPEIRRGLSLVALGFLVGPAFASGFRLGGLVGRLASHSATPWTLEDPSWVLAGGLVGAALLVMARARDGPGERITHLRTHVTLVAAAAATGIALGGWSMALVPGWGSVFVDVLTWTDSLWKAFLPVLLAYAVLRFRFLEADLTARRGLRRASVGGILLATFFVLSEAPQALFSSGFGFVNPRIGPYVGLAAAGILVFFLHPLARLGDRVAEEALPNVRPISDLARSERASLYREQALLAWRDGILNRKERLFLDRLRTRLNLPLAVTTRIEEDVVHELGPPLEDVSGAGPRRRSARPALR